MTTTAATAPTTSGAEAEAAATATAAAAATATAAAAKATAAAAAAAAPAAPPVDAEMTAASSSDDDSSDNESNSSSSSSRSLPWLLGFVEPPTSPLSLLRHHFRSKVGGRPAWLDPCALPTPAQLCCGVTGAPLDFLCQVYAPLDESDESEDDDGEEASQRRQLRKNKHEDAFHRAVFVFVGPSGSALGNNNSNDPSIGNRSIRAFRCQLPRENEHYSPLPPPRGGCPPPRLADASRVTNADRWRVAECEASIVAAAAEAAAAAGGAGQVAAAEAEAAANAAAAAFAKGGGAMGASPAPLRLFPEAELVVEEEGSDCGSDLDEAVAAAERAMKMTATTTRKTAAAAAAAAPQTPAQKAGRPEKETEEAEAEAAAGEEEEEADAEMMDSVEAAVHPDAAAMARFAARVARAPSQVLRYRFDRRRKAPKAKKKEKSRGEGGAIWPRASPKPPSAVPPCPNCGAPRALEFQLLPQMLNFLGCDAADEEAPDWSCVGVWSCVESCSKRKEDDASPASSLLPLSPPPVSKTGGAGISGGPSAYLEEFVWVQPSDAQQGA